MWKRGHPIILAMIIAASSSCNDSPTSPEAGDAKPEREPAVRTVELQEGTVDLFGLPGVFRPTDSSSVVQSRDEEDSGVRQ